MILNALIIVLIVLSLIAYTRVQLGNKMRAFLIGIDDMLLEKKRFYYLKKHVSQISPECQVLLLADPFNKALWDTQSLKAADTFVADQLNLSPEQLQSIREKDGYYDHQGAWVDAPRRSRNESREDSSDDDRDDSEFGGGGGFDGGGAGGSF
jgi:hypothetical protein